MKLIADLHTHTIASTHAYSTVMEMLTAAKAGGLKALAITDHGCGMPDSPHEWHFLNLHSLPHWHDGFLLLRGAEANVIDSQGSVDLQDSTLKKLDWVVASMHLSVVQPMRYEAATAAWLTVARHPYVDMIGHSEMRQYRYDYDLVTRAFAQNNKVVEMNASSAVTRPGNEENMRELALACKRNGAKIAVNSDAHSVFDLFNQNSVLAMLRDIDFPAERIINSDMDLLLAELKLHSRSLD